MTGENENKMSKIEQKGRPRKMESWGGGMFKDVKFIGQRDSCQSMTR